MKRNIFFATALLTASCLLAADSETKDSLKSVAKKLTDSGYTWKQTSQNNGGGGGGGGGGGASEGKVDKEGVVSMSMGGRNGSRDVLIKGGKAAIKTEDGWQTPEEVAAAAANNGGGGGGGRNRGGRFLQNFKAPASRLDQLIDGTTNVKTEGDVTSAVMTEEGAKQMLTFGGRGRGGNGNAPEISDAKGSVKFWIKEGVFSKIEYTVQGKISRNGQDRDVDRTTTLEFSDIGSTKVSIPDEAAKKLQ